MVFIIGQKCSLYNLFIHVKRSFIGTVYSAEWGEKNQTSNVFHIIQTGHRGNHAPVWFDLKSSEEESFSK